MGLSASRVMVPTGSIHGLEGLLDFKFATLPPAPAQAMLTIAAFETRGGMLGAVTTMGNVSGVLGLESELVLLNTPESPSSEYSVRITFGSRICFVFGFTSSEIGGAFTQGSAFGFSVLSESGESPLLLVPEWQTLDPSGFVFLADLDTDGGTRISSYVANASYS